MNPFDWKSMVLAKHAQHVVLIHFPIALYLVAVGLDLLAHWFNKRGAEQVVYGNLTLAALFTIPALITGVTAWQWQLAGQRLKGIVLYHLVGAVASSALIWLSWWLHGRLRRGTAPPVGLRLAVELLGALVVVVTGHLGGFLSGVNS